MGDVSMQSVAFQEGFFEQTMSFSPCLCVCMAQQQKEKVKRRHIKYWKQYLCCSRPSRSCSDHSDLASSNLNIEMFLMFIARFKVVTSIIGLERSIAMASIAILTYPYHFDKPVIQTSSDTMYKVFVYTFPPNQFQPRHSWPKCALNFTVLWSNIGAAESNYKKMIGFWPRFANW